MCVFSYHGQAYRCRLLGFQVGGTVKLGNKEHFDKEQIGVKEPLPVTNCQFTS